MEAVAHPDHPLWHQGDRAIHDTHGLRRHPIEWAQNPWEGDYCRLDDPTGWVFSPDGTFWGRCPCGELDDVCDYCNG